MSYTDPVSDKFDTHTSQPDAHHQTNVQETAFLDISPGSRETVSYSPSNIYDAIGVASGGPDIDVHDYWFKGDAIYADCTNNHSSYIRTVDIRLIGRPL